MNFFVFYFGFCSERVFGMTLLIMLASCLLHLVATSYFLFFELLNDPVFVCTKEMQSQIPLCNYCCFFSPSTQDMFVASLQLLWCCFHVSRLLLIVEPCHMATTEVLLLNRNWLSIDYSYHIYCELFFCFVCSIHLSCQRLSCFRREKQSSLFVKC